VRHALHHDVFVRESGRHEGPRTVLWIHGLGESGLGFEEILDRPELAGWRHIVPDLPGYGRTVWPGEPMRLTAQADLLADLVQDLAGGPVVVVGHSMGGVIALLLAERHRSLVRGVLDVDGNKSLDDCTYSGQAADQDIVAFTDGGFDRLRDAVYRAGDSEAAQRGYYASLRQASPVQFWLNSGELVAMSRTGDLARRLADLDVPRAYVAGTPGGASEASRRLLAATSVPVLEVRPSGHWPFVDLPDAFVAALMRFLDDLA
jgi:pimeloyl-ACP methyl ester carboxylesterase